MCVYIYIINRVVQFIHSHSAKCLKNGAFIAMKWRCYREKIGCCVLVVIFVSIVGNCKLWELGIVNWELGIGNCKLYRYKSSGRYVVL